VVSIMPLSISPTSWTCFTVKCTRPSMENVLWETRTAGFCTRPPAQRPAQRSVPCFSFGAGLMMRWMGFGRIAPAHVTACTHRHHARHRRLVEGVAAALHQQRGCRQRHGCVAPPRRCPHTRARARRPHGAAAPVQGAPRASRVPCGRHPAHMGPAHMGPHRRVHCSQGGAHPVTRQRQVLARWQPHALRFVFKRNYVGFSPSRLGSWERMREQLEMG
jgi:hypothetical protein